MKRIFSLLFLFISVQTALLCCFTVKVKAEETVYGRILNQTTYLYNSAGSDSPCFLIPETYYVKIVRDDGDFCFVEYLEDVAPYYKSIAGYCKKTDLYICDYIPANPYLKFNIAVNDGSKGYKSSSISKVDYLFNSGNPIILYGKFKINNVLFYYVLAHGEYRCYINANECTAVNYPLNEDPLPISQTDPIETPEKPSPEDNSTAADKLKIALILILVIPALIATAFLFKPQKKKSVKESNFYDENDYE